jgi:hypothetical protein
MNQITKGQSRRFMYIENKDGEIYGSDARIGWVTFSKTGKSIYYKDKTLKRISGGGVAGNYYDNDTGDEYWISGIKKEGCNSHWAEKVKIEIDEDALEEYKNIKGNKSR